MDLTLLAFGLLVAANAADVFTTVHALELGGVEANRFARWMFDTFGILPASIILKVVQLFLLWAVSDWAYAWALYLALAGYFGYVAWRNWKVVRFLAT